MANEEIDPRLRESTGTLAQNTTSTPIAPHPYATYAQAGSPDLNPYSNSPQSIAPAIAHGNHGDQEAGSSDAKRVRACEPCRGLKVRCEFETDNTNGPCKRCKKANRQCVVTEPSRKRQKKADSRVAELEKKIDALTASLHAKTGSTPATHSNDNGIEHERTQSQSSQNTQNVYQQVTNGRHGFQLPGRSEERQGPEWSGYPKGPEFESAKASLPPMIMAGQKRKYTENREYSTPPDGRSPSIGGRSYSSNAGFRQDGKPAPASQIGAKAQTHEYADVIDRGIVTSDMAALMFNCYVEKMAPHMPSVVFPPGTTAADIRKAKPTLFLAILSASAGMNYPQVQRTFTKELMAIYADRIICNGEKTLEIIQALHVSTLWYWPPEHFEELKFYQLIHVAAVMAIDIGMGKKSKNSKGKNAGLWRDHPWRRTPYPDPESIEARRAWLSCYFLCCNAAMGLRRPNLIRWSSFMADCVDVLEHSPEAAHSDKVLCQWVRSQRIAEEVGTQFSMDDPSASVNIADAKVQYALKGFERDLEKWTNNITPDVQTAALKTTGHVVNLYMHEVALHVDHNVDEFKPPFTEAALRTNGEDLPTLTSAHIDALSTCLAAIDGIFEEFLKFDIETIRCLPVLHFVRVAYAVVVLIKMYFAAAAPNSELGSVINKDNMKVEQYLDGLVDIFRASSAEEKSRPSAKFLMVLIMLKTWFHRQREGKTTPNNGQETSTWVTVPTTQKEPEATESRDNNREDQRQSTQSQPGQPINYTPTNTPLQLLSEVATGNSGGPTRSDNMSAYSGTPSAGWPQNPQYNYDPSLQGPQIMGQAYNTMTAGLDPSLNQEFNYMIGDGFEQAMGMTLGGVSDFGQYISDDTFFGSLMENVPGGPGFEGFSM